MSKKVGTTGETCRAATPLPDLPGKDGLVHISQISDERVENVSDKLNEGDIIKVKVLEVDRQGRVRLSMRDLEAA